MSDPRYDISRVSRQALEELAQQTLLECQLESWPELEKVFVC